MISTCYDRNHNTVFVGKLENKIFHIVLIKFNLEVKRRNQCLKLINNGYFKFKNIQIKNVRY